MQLSGIPDEQHCHGQDLERGFGPCSGSQGIWAPKNGWWPRNGRDFGGIVGISW